MTCVETRMLFYTYWACQQFSVADEMPFVVVAQISVPCMASQNHQHRLTRLAVSPQ